MCFYSMFPTAAIAALRQMQFPPLLRQLLIVAQGQSAAELARVLGKPTREIRLALGVLLAAGLLAARPAYKRKYGWPNAAITGVYRSEVATLFARHAA